MCRLTRLQDQNRQSRAVKVRSFCINSHIDISHISNCQAAIQLLNVDPVGSLCREICHLRVDRALVLVRSIHRTLIADFAASLHPQIRGLHIGRLVIAGVSDVRSRIKIDIRSLNQSQIDVATRLVDQLSAIRTSDRVTGHDNVAIR